MDQRTRNWYSAGSLALLAILFMALVILTESLFSGWRVDLTANKQYTLSEGTRNILKNLEEPVNLYLFFSEETSRDLPQIRRYAQWVGELLEEMEVLGGTKLTLHRVNPEPFSTDEDRAGQFGLQAVPVGATGDSLYFGLAATNSLDDVQAMPFLQPSKEQFLEYDVAKMVSSLSHPKRSKVGLLAGLDMKPGYDPARQAMRPAWTIYEQLQQAFEVVEILPESGELPEDLDLLFLVHPKNLDDQMTYAIDQFVLNGGRLVAFMDPFAEADQGGAPGDPMAPLNAGSSSSLGALLEAWGVNFDATKMIGDALYALQVGMGGGSQPVRHLAILSVPRDGLNQEDIVSADLEAVNFSSSGFLEAVEGASTTLTPLARTSQNAAPIDAQRMRFLTDPRDLMNGFQSTGDLYTLAARVSGPASSAFDSAPGASDNEHMAQSSEQGIQVLLFADTDILTDRLWVQKQNFLGQTIASSFADNGNLVINAVDHLLGSPDLISVRTRATTSRPFDRVERLRLAAETRFRATEERLQQELEDTEQKLAELQSSRDDGNLDVFSDEQREAVDRFMQQRLQIRSDLRAVRHDLERDIDALGTRLKLANIALMPLLVAVAALVYVRSRRKRREEAA
ncbi:MAG: ABC transporter [Xanthomonadales bacterium]|nr:ABC transporter [Xanthomonadales bacterium]